MYTTIHCRQKLTSHFLFCLLPPPISFVLTHLLYICPHITLLFHFIYLFYFLFLYKKFFLLLPRILLLFRVPVLSLYSLVVLGIIRLLPQGNWNIQMPWAQEKPWFRERFKLWSLFHTYYSLYNHKHVHGNTFSVMQKLFYIINPINS